jgi:hypothetical protein
MEGRKKGRDEITNRRGRLTGAGVARGRRGRRPLPRGVPMRRLLLLRRLLQLRPRGAPSDGGGRARAPPGGAGDADGECGRPRGRPSAGG